MKRSIILLAAYRSSLVTRILILVLSILATACLAQAQPPPLGPPTYRSDKQQLIVGVLTLLVKGKVTESVATANQAIRDRGKNTSLELMPLKINKPLLMATQHTNFPNQYYVNLSWGITINVKIPVVADRTIYIPLDLAISCEGWQTGKGKVVVVARTGPPSVEGGNIGEDIVFVRDYIDNQIKRNLVLPGAIATAVPNSPCVTLGTSPGEPPDYRFGFIAYDAPLGVRPLEGVRVGPTLEVTFLRLKRLRARQTFGGGGVLYHPVENIVLLTYANYESRQSSTLTMREDDEVPLSLAPVVLKAGSLESLVMIANIRQQPVGGTEDSNFAVWPRSANFSPGMHTLQITKVYVEPPGVGHPKPLFIRVPAYELTYNVRYTDPGLVR